MNPNEDMMVEAWEGNNKHAFTIYLQEVGRIHIEQGKVHTSTFIHKCHSFTVTECQCHCDMVLESHPEPRKIKFFQYLILASYTIFFINFFVDVD